MPRFVRIRNSLAPLLHPLQAPAPSHPLANQPTPNDHLRAMRSLPPNVRLADISKGIIPREGNRRQPYRSRSDPGLSHSGKRNAWRMLMYGDGRLTEQQKIIKDEKKHWHKDDLRQLNKRGGLRWALRER